MTDLDKLIEAVEAGDNVAVQIISKRIASTARDKGELWPSLDVENAMSKGSLDAFLALCDAMLPGISQYSIVTDPTCLCVKVAWWPDGLSGDRCIQGEAWSEDDPARAGLLAILRAYRSQVTK